MPTSGNRTQMNHKSHTRIQSVPLVVVVLSALVLIAVLTVRQVSGFLSSQMQALPLITACVAALAPVIFLSWYCLSYAHVRRGQLRVRSLMTRQLIDLRTLVAAEVHSRGRSDGKRGSFALLLHLEDADGRQLWLPLNHWQDEDLLMARVLRATVDCRVRIEGDPMLVRRLSGLIESYKSWDRQLAA